MDRGSGRDLHRAFATKRAGAKPRPVRFNVVLFVQLPASFDLLDMGPRIARPLVACVGGLVVTGIIVMVTRPRPPQGR
jgi:hypothetical protein